jgi:hypothetical protein
LAAGVNEAGKSCLAEAVRAVLAGEPIPIPGVAKKDAKLLVRDGAEEGRATANTAEVMCSVGWPKADVRFESSDGPKHLATHFAVGLKHLFDLDVKERSTVLAGYVDSTPTVDDLGDAMRDAGYGATAIAKTWGAIKEGGWDATYKRAREYGTRLKGQWEGVTREKYGSKKAEGWAPENYPATNRQDPLVDQYKDLEQALELARAKVKAAVGSAAVSQAEVERLKAEAAAEVPNVKPLRKDLEAAQSDLALVEAERRVLPAEGKDGGNTVAACPECGCMLAVEQAWQGPILLKPYSEDIEKKAASKQIHLKRAELDGKAANLKGKINDARQALSRAEAQADRVAEAKRKLAEIGEVKAPDEEAVKAAEQAEADARDALAAFDAKAEADRLHGEVQKNEQLAGVLAPDGLRKRKLAAGLTTFNEKLAELCTAAKWPVVRIDENLAAHYGTRPLWSASSSGRWRARVVVQVAMAQMDGSAAVVIDEADILDSRGRNALMQMLNGARVKALVCMTISKPSLVPDLKQAVMGASFWVSSGVVVPVDEAVQAQGKAA